MKRYLISLLTLVAITALATWAADIDGTWTAERQGKNGTRTTTLTLTTKGTVVMGKMDSGRGGPVDISDGKYDGKTLTFKVETQGKNGKQDREYKGMMSGGDLKLQYTGGRGPVEMEFKKK
jgi:hypothetical protein